MNWLIFFLLFYTTIATAQFYPGSMGDAVNMTTVILPAFNSEKEKEKQVDPADMKPFSPNEFLVLKILVSVLFGVPTIAYVAMGWYAKRDE